MTKRIYRKRQRAALYAEVGIPDRMEKNFSMGLVSTVVGMDAKMKPIHANIYVIDKATANANRKHRVFCVCPDCGFDIPLSRIHQHMGTKACARNRKEQ